jgi:hypothetical protein
VTSSLSTAENTLTGRSAHVVAAMAAMLRAPLPALSQETNRSSFYIGGHVG